MPLLVEKRIAGFVPFAGSFVMSCLAVALPMSGRALFACPAQTSETGSGVKIYVGW